MKDEELKKLENEVVEVKKILGEVHTAIIGNPLSQDGGMVRRLMLAESKIIAFELRITEAEKKQIKYNVYTIVMWLALGGVAAMIVSYIMTLIFNHR